MNYANDKNVVTLLHIVISKEKNYNEKSLIRPLNYVTDKNVNTLVHTLNSKEKKSSYFGRNFIMIYIEAAKHFTLL